MQPLSESHGLEMESNSVAVWSGVTLTCISSSTEHPEMTSALQSLTYFKARLILSKQQLYLRAKRQK